MNNYNLTLPKSKKKLLRNMALSYIFMRKTSYTIIADKYDMSKYMVNKYLNIYLPKNYPILSVLVDNRAKKNLLNAHEAFIKRNKK